MNILSIQSGVAYGHVGNSVACFALQRLGHEVWRVDTVQFSNHTGYEGWRGTVFDPDQVADVIAGIEDRGLFGRCDGMLSGYVGNGDLGDVIASANARLRVANPNAIYCCDPVMGDVDRGLYVGEQIPKVIRTTLVPTATIVTPNQFELELLTGQQIDSLDQALKAADGVREMGPRVVLLTSLRRSDAPPDTVEMLAVARDEAWLVSTPLLRFQTAPNGSGDLVSALFLARHLETGELSRSLSLTASSVFDVLYATREAGGRELQLIQAQDILVRPHSNFEPRQVR